jgi:tRNA nucleotidyltransferase (CCA-adding enzyme)
MKKYLVGGFVRDQVMNQTFQTTRVSHDKDWLVVGSTADEMLKKGFIQVGCFPVYLHPTTKEEWALARTEKKTGKGHQGFEVHFSSDVTLDDDLKRRDLTINAMAQDPKTGIIIDPHHGKIDIKNKQLRHVSSAFSEDPLRVLRVARFAARFSDFSIAKETMLKMKMMAHNGELTHLTSERVWKEVDASLKEEHPEIFFTVLRQCEALQTIWPELNALWNVPNPVKWHPEVCSGVHTLMVLEQAVRLSSKTKIRFAALCHDLGKALTPKEVLPSHKGHEKTGLPLVLQTCERFKVPNAYKELALKVCQFHLHAHKAFELHPKTILKLFNQLDVWRKPEILDDFLMVCEADYKGRLSFENRSYPQRLFLKKLMTELLDIDVQKWIKKGLKGIKIKEAIHKHRIAIIARGKKNTKLQIEM